MTASSEDWRLKGHKKYLKGAALHWKAWSRGREHRDHGHCAFCGTLFRDSDDPDVLREGYTTEDERYWICTGCMEDFREMFQWRIAADVKGHGSR